MIVKEEIKLSQDGEIIEGKIETIKKVSPEQFTQVYLQNNDEFYCLTKAEANVLGICWNKSQYYDDPTIPGNIVQYNQFLLNDILSKTKLAESSIKHAFSELCRKRMLLKGKNKGIYFLNPEFFFKGKISDRLKALEVSVRYVTA